MILIAASRQHAGEPGAGQWKDSLCLQRLLASEDAVSIVHFEQDDWSPVLSAVDATTTHVVVYYTFWPELLAALRSGHPHCRVLVRAVNAEALQSWDRLDWGRASVSAKARGLYGCLRLVLRDRACRNAAHGVLCISEWDLRHYWRRLGGTSRLFDTPYYSPYPYLDGGEGGMAWREREPVVLCMPGGRDRIGRSQVRGFESLAQACGEAGRRERLRFQLTPGLGEAVDEPTPSPWIEHLQVLSDHWATLQRVRAVALLSPLGYGAKTTLVDALAAGCHVIVHPELHARLPRRVQDLCLQWHPESGREELAALVATIEHPRPHGGVNSQLEAAARAAVRAALVA